MTQRTGRTAVSGSAGRLCGHHRVGRRNGRDSLRVEYRQARQCPRDYDARLYDLWNWEDIGEGRL